MTQYPLSLQSSSALDPRLCPRLRLCLPSGTTPSSAQLRPTSAPRLRLCLPPGTTPSSARIWPTPASRLRTWNCPYCPRLPLVTPVCLTTNSRIKSGVCGSSGPGVTNPMPAGTRSPVGSFSVARGTCSKNSKSPLWFAKKKCCALCKFYWKFHICKFLGANLKKYIYIDIKTICICIVRGHSSPVTCAWQLTPLLLANTSMIIPR